MAELADAADSKSAGLRPLGVRLPLPAPLKPPGLNAGINLLHPVMVYINAENALSARLYCCTPTVGFSTGVLLTVVARAAKKL